MNGRWLVSFVESRSQRPFDFHPALAGSAEPEPWAGLAKVGAADDLHQCEGPILTRVGDRWWVVASDGKHRQYPVFDLRMRRVGRLHAPYLSNIPHAQLLRRDETSGGGWLVLSFDGTQYAHKTMGYGGHGDVVVMAEQPQPRPS